MKEDSASIEQYESVLKHSRMTAFQLLPGAVREALARDVWVIATDAGGAVEDIVAGKNGDIIPISSGSTHLRKAMEEIVANKNFLQNYSNPHKDNIRNFDQQADELLAYLMSVIKLHSR